VEVEVEVVEVEVEVVVVKDRLLSVTPQPQLISRYVAMGMSVEDAYRVQGTD
jgi:hypothetical protein